MNSVKSVEIGPSTRRSLLAPDDKFMDFLYDECKTSHEVFIRGMKLAGHDGKCLGIKENGVEYSWLTYKQIYDMALDVGSGLIHLGIEPCNKTIIGMYASNSANWVIADRACGMFSMILAPIYDTFGFEACTFCINQTEAQVLFCDKESKVDKIISEWNIFSFLKYIIIFESISSELSDKALHIGLKIYTMDELMFFGRENRKQLNPPNPDDIFTICFTSGTSGISKGVILTHKNVILNSNALSLVSKIEINTSVTHICYLPLAHMIERMTHLIVQIEGGRIGIFTGDTKNLLNDLTFLKPDFFVSVPRVLNRIFDKVNTAVSSNRMKYLLFKLALNKKMKLLQDGIVTKNTKWDRLVFGKIQALLGGNVKLIISGSAPLAVKVHKFLICAMGCPVIEAYGQTESSTGITGMDPLDLQSGHVGAPLPINIVKLVDVPEMDYFADKNGGEICYKGPCVTQGYLKNETATKELIDEDGWAHSGDIGIWLPNGVLKIIDRKKNIFKLSQGEYIAPEKLENIYSNSPYIQQICVDGQTDQSYLIAIVVPDFDVLYQWSKDNHVEFTSNQELCSLNITENVIFESMNKIAKKSKLLGFEKVKKIHVIHNLFSVDNNLMTPTFKLKRANIRIEYKKVIREMYETVS